MGGAFTIAGGDSVNCVARWDGSQWHPMAEGLGERVNALAVYHGEIYAGGDFNEAAGGPADHIARWDGTSWQPVAGGVSGGVWPGVTCLTVHNGSLIAGGWFTEAGGVEANYIARYDGSAWHALGGGMDNWVWAVTDHFGELIAGGDFLFADGTTEVNRIAAWDGGAWQPIGAGVNDWVRALGEAGGSLHVGGMFHAAGGVPSYYVARWDPAASTCLYDCEDPGAPIPYFLDLRCTNPGLRGTRVGFELPAPAPVQLTVHDVEGRRIATLLDGPTAIGEHRLTWDGVGDRGQRVRPGLYFIRLRTRAGTMARKLLLTR